MRDRAGEPSETPVGSPGAVAHVLAEVFATGPWREDDLVARGAVVLGRRWRWLRPLVRRILAHSGEQARPPRAPLERFLLEDRPFRAACAKHPVRVNLVRWPEPVMWPAGVGPGAWNVPAIASAGALADWLELATNELDWLADPESRLGKLRAPKLGHYAYQWRSKGGGTARLIEAPKPRLKALQRRLLAEILDRIPPHEAAHGFRRGRSVASFAGPHVGQRVVLKMDLRDFFPSVSAARVFAVFRTAGYPDEVVRLLGGLCTTSAPTAVWDEPGSPAREPFRGRSRRLYRRRHLPQGAPTSPSLANLCAYRLDRRLSALAESAGGRYTRYADDLVISGGRDLERSAARLHVHVCAVALEEGFEVNTRKTKLLRQGVRQRIGGLVVNEHANIPRDAYDRLKAILHNCVRAGPVGQNREGHPDFRAHLAGRVAYVAAVNPARGARLRSMFDRIPWT
jgi:hypothetical protein